MSSVDQHFVLSDLDDQKCFIGGDMKEEFDIYTGQLMYKEIFFSFVFDRDELRLIPPKEKVHEVSLWMMTPIGNGVYTMGNPIHIEDQLLKGFCNETQQDLVFIPTNNSIGSNNNVLIVKIAAYIVLKYDRNVVDRISIQSTEIDYIHPVNQVYRHIFGQKAITSDGIISFTTKGFSDTTTEKREFVVDDKTISVNFGITRGISTKIGEPPLSFKSTLMFEFEPTKDYVFLFRLWKIAVNFIQYLCYRKNVKVSLIDLSAPFEGGKHESFANMYIVDRDSIEIDEKETLSNGRYIKQIFIDGFEGKILSDIASGVIYTRHIPNSYRIGRSIDAARFVMISAAFEWEFKRTYPEGVVKKEKTKLVENTAIEEVQKLIDSSTGKLKAKYIFLKKLVKSDSLQSEIEQMGKDFDTITGIFGRRLYSINNEELKYSEMGRRLSDQRNHFAHGDLDQDFIGLALLDLVYLEYIVYAMQLKLYGVDETNIKKAINELFHCGMIINNN